MNFGLLQRVPLVGDKLHTFVENNRELVKQALKGKIYFILKVVNKFLPNLG